MDPIWMTTHVHAVLPDATVHATDLNGGGDHWHLVVVDASFEGERQLTRQRRVFAAFRGPMEDGTIHALDLKCVTPTEAKAGIPEPFVPHRAGEGSHPGAW